VAIDDVARVVRLAEESVEARTSPIVEVHVAPRDEALATRQLDIGGTGLSQPLDLCGCGRRSRGSEVQSLGGGESHWVPISALSPPRAN